MKFTFDGYTVESVENNGDTMFKVTFCDSNGEVQSMDISPEVFEAFDAFKKVEKKFLNFYDNHLIQADLTPETIHSRAMQKSKTVEEMLEDLHREALFDKALDSLTDT